MGTCSVAADSSKLGQGLCMATSPETGVATADAVSSDS